VAVLAAAPAWAHKAPVVAGCAAASALQSPNLPSDIAVKIDPQIEAPATQALNFWASKLGVEWHRDNSPQTCNLDIEYRGLAFVFLDGVNETGHVLGAAALPTASHYAGVVYVFRDADGTRYAHTIAHELGHALGYEHSKEVGLMSPGTGSMPSWNLSPAEINFARAIRVRAKLAVIAKN
jgi:hypothetical protein